jgi:hypothetical protein
MQNLSLIEEVLETIEQDENSLRIKRLIVFACHGFWVDDPQDLESMELRTLIEELLAAIPDVDTLKHMLNSSVKKLSKPEVYSLVADMIIDSIGLLYTLSPKTKAPEPMVADIPPELVKKLAVGVTVGLANVVDDNGSPTHVNTTEYTTDDSTAIERKVERLVGRKYDSIPNLFDLKLEISNSVTPLRAKILVFSKLHYLFDPRDRSWGELNSHDLSELLESLYQLFSTVEDLEEGLRDTANQMGGDQEYLQAAGMITNYMKPLYFS